MNTLRSQLDEIFNGTLEEGTGLLRLAAKSENIKDEWPRGLAEAIVRPMEAIRRVEASLIRAAGINPERIESLLADGNKRRDLADILQQAAGEIPIERTRDPPGSCGRGSTAHCPSLSRRGVLAASNHTP